MSRHWLSVNDQVRGHDLGFCRGSPGCRPIASPVTAGGLVMPEHKHVYLRSPDDMVGVCECGKAFVVCPCCGTAVDPSPAIQMLEEQMQRMVKEAFEGSHG